MSLCQSIDTLSMAFLDDELAGEERRELELHLIDCAACRAHVDGEKAELNMLRGALAPPAMPDLFRAKLGRVLDAEDAQVQKTERKRWSRYLLPGSAMIAAAAALAVFVAVRPADDKVSATTHEVVRQQTRSMPLEVQGASTGPWLREHFAPTMELLQFSANEPVKLMGARLTAVNGHDAALLEYNVSFGDAPFRLSAVVVRDLRSDELSGGQEIQVGDRALHLVEIDGVPAVTFVDDNRTGYVFMASRLSANELVRLVVSSNLIDRAQNIR
jgi:anti-sigma factor RsiW